jgi:hypothetical protein
MKAEVSPTADTVYKLPLTGKSRVFLVEKD